MFADVATASASATPQAQFLTAETLFTAAGATTAVIAVTSMLQVLIPKLPAKWVGLVLAFVITLLAIQAHGERYTGINIVLAIVNGFVTYAAAVGVNNVSTSPRPTAAAPPAAAVGKSMRWWP